MADNTELAAKFWDDWNAKVRTPERLYDVPLDQRKVVLDWLRSRQVRDAKILDVGCGTGWLCDSLVEFGTVTGVDLSRNCLEEARRRAPQATFMAGDFMEMEFEPQSFDVICTLEVLAHVVDQQAFIAKIARLLKPGGLLMLATQNKPMLQRWANVDPLAPGQLRKWRDQQEVRDMLAPAFNVLEMRTITPVAHKFPMRFLTAKKVRRLIPGFTQWQERRGWGWTIVVLASRRDG